MRRVFLYLVAISVLGSSACGAGEVTSAGEGQAPPATEEAACTPDEPQMVRRSYASSLDALKADADDMVEISIIDRQVVAAEPMSDANPTRHVASARVVTSVAGVLTAGDVISLLLSYSPSGQPDDVLSPGITFALQPGATALVALLPPESGYPEHLIAASTVILVDGERLEVQGPECRPVPEVETLAAEVERLTRDELIAALRS